MALVLHFTRPFAGDFVPQVLVNINRRKSPVLAQAKR
jgi:hypothetical protein